MKKKLNRITAFAPIFLLMGIAYLLPLLSNIIKSFQNDDGVFVGMQNYADVISSYYFLDSLGFTLRIALVTTAVSMAIAIIVSLALRESFAGKKLVLFLLQYNLCVPHMAVAMMMIMLLSQTGILSSLAFRLGITDSANAFPFFVRDSKGLGITLTFIWKYFPYIALSVLGILQGASLEYEQQAACLGIGKWKRFSHVILPKIIPATSVASIMVFSAAFGEYEIPALLGSSTHRTLSIMVYMKYCDMSTRDRPAAYAMMVMMMLVQMLIITAFYFATARGRGDDK